MLLRVIWCIRMAWNSAPWRLLVWTAPSCIFRALRTLGSTSSQQLIQVCNGQAQAHAQAQAHVYTQCKRICIGTCNCVSKSRKHACYTHSFA